MFEVPMTFKEIEGVPSEFEGMKKISIDDRPLIHILLIQESMELDSLRAVRALESFHSPISC